MTEKLDSLLTQTLQKFLDGIDATTAFAQQQLPDVIQQILHWYFIYYSLTTLFAILAFSLQAYISYYWITKVEPKLDCTTQWIGSIFGLGLGGIIPLFIEIHFLNLQWLKIWIAPKLWLIEYTAHLTK